MGSPAALAQHMARVQLTQRAVFFLAQLALPMLQWKNRAVLGVRREEGRPLSWSSWLPSGTLGRFLTPQRVCSSPRVCPHQADKPVGCCVCSSEDSSEKREKVEFPKQQSGISLGDGCMAASIPGLQGYSMGWGFSICPLREKRTHHGGKVGKTSRENKPNQKEVSSAQPETTPPRTKPTLFFFFFPFWGYFLPFFNPSPFDSQFQFK